MRLSFNRQDEQQKAADMFEPFKDSVAWLPQELRQAVEQRHDGQRCYERERDDLDS